MSATEEIEYQNESLCVVSGSYSHLTRSHRHLNSGENMKARLMRRGCDTNVLNLN